MREEELEESSVAHVKKHKKNKHKKVVILDIPLLLENKINTKKDIFIFVD